MTLSTLPINPRNGMRAVGLRKDGRPIWPIAGGDGTTTNPMLARLYEDRQKQIDFVEQTLKRATDEGRSLVEAETGNITAARQSIEALDAQIKPIEEFETARAAGSAAANQFRPSFSAGGGQGAPAGAGGGQSLGAQTDPRAYEYKSAGQVLADMVRSAPSHRGGMNDAEAARRLESAGVSGPADEGQARVVANQTTTDLTGILPTPIVGAIVSSIDDRRPFVTSIGARDMGNIPGKVFSRPIITQHVAVGEQTTEKTELTSQKMIVSDVDFTKKTFGGVIDVSRQTIDWTSPAAWDALLTDLQKVYAKFTENAAGDAFAATVVSTPIEVGGTGSASTFEQWATAFYAAAAQVYAGVEELPDHIWMGMDMWAILGPKIDQWTRQTANNSGGPSVGDSSPASFGGNFLDIPRTVVPSFPASTLIVGRKEYTEFYEQRIGLLTAVEPRLLGVEVAYGGYAAYNTLDADAFAKIVNAA